MKKEKLKVFLKCKTFVTILTGFIALSMVSCFGTSESESKILELNTEIESSKEIISKLEAENKSLQAKIDEAKPWFEMKEEEKKAKEAELQAKKEEEERAKAAAAEDEKLAKEEEEKKGYNTGITYEQLARTPDNFKNKKIKFRGKVIQVMEGNQETQIRLAINDNYDTIILCGLSKNLTQNNRILQNDQITVMGISLGLITYTSTMGGEITIPSMIVDKLDR